MQTKFYRKTTILLLLIISLALLIIALLLTPKKPIGSDNGLLTTSHYDPISDSEYSLGRTGGYGESNTVTILGIENLKRAGLLTDEVSFIHTRLPIVLMEKLEKKPKEIVSIDKKSILLSFDSNTGRKTCSFDVYLNESVSIKATFILSKELNEPTMTLIIEKPDGEKITVT